MIALIEPGITDLLPAEAVACRHCGSPVPREGAEIVRLISRGYVPTDPQEQADWEARVKAEREEIERWDHEPGKPDGHRPSRDPLIDFATCSTCAASLARARQIVEEHRGVKAHVGGILLTRIEAALLRLDVIGVSLPADLSNDAVYDLHVMLGDAPGNLTRWQSRFHPHNRRQDSARTCTVKPWAHVPADERAEISRASRQWSAARLQERRTRTETMGPIPCPSRGCALCGIASVVGLPREVKWQSFSAHAFTLGGRGSKRIDGHTCPTCSQAYEKVGAVGVGLLERALLDALDPEHRIVSAGAELDGVIAWAVSGERPSARPWEHVVPGGDLRAALYGPDDDARALVERLLAKVPADALRAILAERR